jgi:hypothetical protein
VLIYDAQAVARIQWAAYSEAVPAVRPHALRNDSARASPLALACVLVVCPLLFLADSYAMGWWPSQIRPFFILMAGLAVCFGSQLLRNQPADAGLASADR